MNSGSVEWLQAIELERNLTLADWNKAKEMEVAGREMSYDEGYAEGYKRALELVKWKINNELAINNK
jgi:hypothetical protein